MRTFPFGKFLYKALSLLGSAKTVVVLTKDIANDLLASGYGRVTVIPNPISNELEEAPLPADSPRIALLLGRATPQKGFDIFLEAMSRIQPDGWHFNIMGPGVELDLDLHELIRRHNLHSLVSLLPATEDPYLQIRRSSCVIMPSRYEALPMVALESLRIGRPLIASDVDGLRNLITNGCNGLVFPCGDVKELADRITAICGNQELLKSLAANATASVRGYSSDAIVEAWVQLTTACSKQQSSGIFERP